MKSNALNTQKVTTSHPNGSKGAMLPEALALLDVHAAWEDLVSATHDLVEVALATATSLPVSQYLGSPPVRPMRAMSRKRSKEAMAALEQEFLEGAGKNGVDDNTVATAFKQITSFAEFGFCKAHAAALAETTYRSAWLKLYYPTEYYCALLNCQPMGFYSPEVIVNHARTKGVIVLLVDMNRSDWRCRIDEGGIRLGFRYVKTIGDKTWQNIDVERKRGGFVSLRDRSGISAVRHGIFDRFLNFGAVSHHDIWDF